ncbi:helix-turn-helix domain-containing protein [Aquimarina sp. W85]|uniref:helix-turn-helix domain-containing protein n=1 Tax=Aquimarina rhodophyticola TaxID=3342246 RepID=UPI00366D03D8
MTTLEELELENIKTELLQNVGKNIQRIRENRGLSQVDLAGKMMGKFDTTNISRIESGRNNPTLFTLFRISEALEVTLPELLCFDTP